MFAMTSKLRVVLLQPDFSRYNGAYYQHDFAVALSRRHRVFRYGPGLDGYDPAHTLGDVLGACPFDPDVICFGAGWEVEDMRKPEFDPHPNIRVAGSGIAAVMVLNKEYKKLDRKLAFVRDNGLFEVLASRTLLLCSRSPVYGDLLTDLENCVMFESDLQDFDDKVFSYLRREDEREAIVRNAHAHVLENHTWDRRVEQFTSAVETVI